MVLKLDDQRMVLRARISVPQHVVYRDFPAETVVLNLQAGRYYGLNPTAGRMLAALDRTELVEDAAKAVAGEFSRPLREVEVDICRLCAQLLDRGLIELVHEAAVL
jgi:hypothetical protein